jgi:hypothetical protein
VTEGRRALALIALVALVALLVVGGCGAAGGPTASAPPGSQTTPTSAVPPTLASPAVTPAASSPAGATDATPLLPDAAADHTLGDTVRLSGGEFVGDQADLTVLEGYVSPPPAGTTAPLYSFLVDITGLDAETFPYNLRDFSLFDDQRFEYQPLFSGGQEPRLEFGDLSPGAKVRGWLTFEGPAQSSYVDLEYAPALALEAAVVRAIPGPPG